MRISYLTGQQIIGFWLKYQKPQSLACFSTLGKCLKFTANKIFKSQLPNVLQGNWWEACYNPALCFSWICSFSLHDPLLQHVCGNTPTMSWRLQQTWGYLRPLHLSVLLLPWKCPLVGKVYKDWSTRLCLSHSCHSPTGHYCGLCQQPPLRKHQSLVTKQWKKWENSLLVSVVQGPLTFTSLGEFTSAEDLP